MRRFEGSIRTLVLVGFIAILALATRRAAAATIAWESPVAINTNDPTQVIKTGMFVVAQGAQQTPNQTVNGITFGAFFTNDNVNVAILNPSGGVAGDAYGPRDSAYARLVSTGIYRSTGANATIAISGLTAGKAYDVQLFTPYWDANYETSFSDGVTSVAMGNTSTQPTYLIGHFTADASTQNIFFTAAGASAYGLFSAIQVQALPEPSSFAVIGLAALALRRRTKRDV